MMPPPGMFPPEAEAIIAEWEAVRSTVGVIAHGTEAAYSKHGCRCDKCRTARSRAAKRAAQFRASHGIEPPRHGVPSGYTHFGCRCQPCRAARSKYMREYKARKREAAA